VLAAKSTRADEICPARSRIGVEGEPLEPTLGRAVIDLWSGFLCDAVPLVPSGVSNAEAFWVDNASASPYHTEDRQ
jgi:hypothetical protein